MSLVRHLYIGIFARDDGVVRFEKQLGSFMRPVVRRPLIPSALEELARAAFGESEAAGLSERVSFHNGYLTCDQNVLTEVTCDFIRLVVKQYDCQVTDFTGFPLRPEELQAPKG